MDRKFPVEFTDRYGNTLYVVICDGYVFIGASGGGDDTGAALVANQLDALIADLTEARRAIS